jgi:CheY-like chemotaxis protein
MKSAELETKSVSLKRFFPQWLRASRKPSTETSPPAAPIVPLGKRVLIVDDDPVVRLATSRVLRTAGFDVVTAADCSEAIGAVGQMSPEVVLVDLNFAPDVSGGGISWDGLGLMCWLRGLKNSKGARFIVITSSDSEKCRERALAAGAVEFFQKPIDHPRLIEALGGGQKPGEGKLIRLFEQNLGR